MEGMEHINLSGLSAAGVPAETPEATPARVVESGKETDDRQSSLSDQMKDVRRQRLRRKVLQDPSLARKLVATEASPVYNARGELIQALGGGELDT